MIDIMISVIAFDPEQERLHALWDGLGPHQQTNSLAEFILFLLRSSGPSVIFLGEAVTAAAWIGEQASRFQRTLVVLHSPSDELRSEQWGILRRCGVAVIEKPGAWLETPFLEDIRKLAANKG